MRVGIVNEMGWVSGSRKKKLTRINDRLMCVNRIHFFLFQWSMKQRAWNVHLIPLLIPKASPFWHSRWLTFSRVEGLTIAREINVPRFPRWSERRKSIHTCQTYSLHPPKQGNELRAPHFVSIAKFRTRCPHFARSLGWSSIRNCVNSWIPRSGGGGIPLARSSSNSSILTNSNERAQDKLGKDTQSKSVVYTAFLLQFTNKGTQQVTFVHALDFYIPIH